MLIGLKIGGAGRQAIEQLRQDVQTTEQKMKNMLDLIDDVVSVLCGEGGSNVTTIGKEMCDAGFFVGYYFSIDCSKRFGLYFFV